MNIRHILFFADLCEVRQNICQKLTVAFGGNNCISVKTLRQIYTKRALPELKIGNKFQPGSGKLAGNNN